MQTSNLAALARLDRLIIAIGDEDFGEHLIASIRAASDADHVMAFAFSPHQPPRMIVSAGALDETATARAAAAYAGSLYLLDPHYAEIRCQQGPVTSWFDFSATQQFDHFREVFLDACGISDILAFASCQGDLIYYVMMLRGGGLSFAPGQRWLLTQLDGALAASIHKHFSYMHTMTGQNQFVIDRVLAEAPSFAALTPRERRVCLGILTGYTSESIAINLAISINSVFTYRKRLYEKLGISSQNELFVKVIAAMMDLSRSDVGAGHARDTLSRPLDAGKDARRERFHEYYMAEAFISDDML